MLEARLTIFRLQVMRYQAVVIASSMLVSDEANQLKHFANAILHLSQLSRIRAQALSSFFGHFAE
jgi:hypothetical protein